MTDTGLLDEDIDMARLDSDLYMDSLLLIGDEHLDEPVAASVNKEHNFRTGHFS